MEGSSEDDLEYTETVFAGENALGVVLFKGAFP